MLQAAVVSVGLGTPGEPVRSDEEAVEGSARRGKTSRFPVVDECEHHIDGVREPRFRRSVRLSGRLVVPANSTSVWPLTVKPTDTAVTIDSRSRTPINARPRSD